MGHIGTFEFSAPLWVYAGGSWHFVSVPAEISDDIADLAAGIRRGFGSLRVRVTVGATCWRTSIFPSGRSGAFMLPVKRAVRVAEQLAPGDDVPVTLELVDL